MLIWGDIFTLYPLLGVGNPVFGEDEMTLRCTRDKGQVCLATYLFYWFSLCELCGCSLYLEPKATCRIVMSYIIQKYTDQKIVHHNILKLNGILAP